MAAHTEPGAWYAIPVSEGSARRGTERAVATKARTAGSGTRPNPATSDRGYTDDESEFIGAIRAYQDRTGRKFPAWSEVLDVIRSLGYAKPAPAPA